MEKISVVIMTYNEKHHIEGLAECLKGVDEIILADDGSTDGMQEEANKYGMTVYRRPEHKETPTPAQVAQFTDRFGWEPRFTTESKINNGAVCRMEAISHAKNDWVFMPDADELVTWDLPYITEKLLPIANQITCDFVHSHKPDGSPERVSTITKLFRKSVSRIEARVHDVLIPTDKMAYTDKMRIDHWQKPNAVDANGNPVHSQSSVLPILEYSVLVDDDLRSRFYLGREYLYYKQYDRAIRLLDEYLKDATWMKEIAHARLYKALALWHSNRGDGARVECLESIKINPDHKEALNLYSEMHYEPWKSKWKRIADNATDQDILF